MMTPEQEIALAVVLWKAFRQKTAIRKRTCGAMKAQVTVNEEVAASALAMAKRLGVKDEFLALLFQMPVLGATFTEVESWEKTCPLYEELSTATSKPVNCGHGGPRKNAKFSRNPKPRSGV